MQDPPLSLLPDAFLLTMACIFGLLGGSFLNVVIYRLPRGQSLAFPGSACPHCKTKIAAYNNIPVLSYLILRGRSRCCNQKISPRYPLIELMGGLLGGAVASMKLLPSADELALSSALLLFFIYLIMGLALIAAAAIDWEHMILPDSITWGGVALGLLSAPIRAEVSLTDSVIGALSGFLIVWFPFIWLHEKIRGFAGMGWGDAKLLALAGAWFGPWGALATLFLGACQGTVFFIIAKLLGSSLDEPEAVRLQREELLEAIEQAEGQEREELLREYEQDPLALPPEEAPGGPRIAFGPFLVLAIIELLLYFPQMREFLYDHLYI